MALATSAQRPLCVDLDGTLVSTDLLWEGVIALIRTDPATILRFPGWLFRGKAHFKQQVASRTNLAPETLPYSAEFLEFLKAEHASGRELILTTAADRSVGEAVATHLGLFSRTLTSDGVTNLSGEAKLKAIQAYLGDRTFDYAGDNRVDLPLWKSAERAIVVNPSSRLRLGAIPDVQVDRVFRQPSRSFWCMRRLLRLHQWSKNFLIFVPLILAHKIFDVQAVGAAMLAFLAFGLVASAAYILNDLSDLPHDREHPTKRYRPLAAGEVKIARALLLVLLLLGSSFSLSIILLPPAFTLVLAGYFAVTLAYSLRLKQLLITDVLVLASLYSVRVISGGVATATVLSPWLIGFSIFFFFSLAFLKRYSELRKLDPGRATGQSGRGYQVDDLDLIRSVGPASGYVAVLIVALYVTSPEVVALYENASVLWLVVPLALYWVSRIWFLAHRGTVHDDPIVFALKDRTSYVVAGLVGMVMLVAIL